MGGWSVLGWSVMCSAWFDASARGDGRSLLNRASSRSLASIPFPFFHLGGSCYLRFRVRTDWQARKACFGPNRNRVSPFPVGYGSIAGPRFGVGGSVQLRRSAPDLLESKIRCRLVGTRLVPAAHIEQFAPPFHLRVRGILDLQPGTRAAVRPIRAAVPLCDDAFEIPLRARTEQIPPASLDVIHVSQAGLPPAA